MLLTRFLRLVVALTLLIQIVPAPALRAAAGDTFVAPTGSDANDCVASATPCATLNAAIAKTSSGGTVFIAIGVYVGTGDSVVSIDRNVSLSGGWDAAFSAQTGMSTVDGQNARRGMLINNSQCPSVSLVVSIERLRIVHAAAQQGAGILVQCGTFTMTRSEISESIETTPDNFIYPPGPAALAVGDSATATVAESLIANNWGAGTGDVAAVTAYGSLTLDNTTLTGAARQGASGFGISIGPYSPGLVLRQSTVTGFRIGLRNDGTFNHVSVENSILSGNGEWDCLGSPVTVLTPNWIGHNVVGKHQYCAVPAGQVFAAGAGLHVLKDNGGPTATHAIGPDSPAFGVGVSCNPNHDQRGAARPTDCSAGAFEPVLKVEQTVAGDLAPGGLVTYTFTIAPHGAAVLTPTTLSDVLPVPLVAVPGSANASAGSVTLTGNTLTWTGAADPATPPIVSVQAQIDAAGPRSIIHNVADVTWQGFSGPSSATDIDIRVFQALPALSNQYCGDFTDDFSNAASGWPVFESDLRRLEYLGGEYRLLTKQAGYIFLMGAPTCPRGDLTVEADLRWVGAPGSDIGLVIEEVGPTGNLYLFVIDVASTLYTVVRYDPAGNPAIVSQGSTHGSMQTGNGTNRLSVDMLHGTFVIRNNGWAITQFNYQPGSTLAWVGVAAAPFDNQPVVDARFDNFRVVGKAGSGSPAALDASLDDAQAPLRVFEHPLLPIAPLESSSTDVGRQLQTGGRVVP